MTKLLIQSMKHPFFLIALLLISPQVKVVAQESAAGGQAAASTPASTNSNQPSGLLTPPPDNAPAPAVTAPPATSPASVTAPAPAPTMTAGTNAAPAKPTAQKMSAHEIAQIQQQEIIRRQELIFRANEALKRRHERPNWAITTRKRAKTISSPPKLLGPSRGRRAPMPPLRKG